LALEEIALVVLEPAGISGVDGAVAFCIHLG
jgi:hypothetical protein